MRGGAALAASSFPSSAYDELPDAVVVADERGEVAVVNPAARRLLGLTADALGRPFAEVLPLIEAGGRDWWACLHPYDGLLTRTRTPERLLALGARQLYVTARLVRDERRRVVRVVVALRDTASRDRADRDRADIVATVAHELRSPLTTIKGFTATLLAKWDRFTDDQRQLMLATVNADADRVTRLIGELLDVSRIESGRLELRRQVVDLIELVGQVFAGQVAAGEPAERFVLDKEGALPELWLDRDKTLQVLSNLVENAVRHGGGTVTVSVRAADGSWTGSAAAVEGSEATSGELPDGVVVSVADEGEGVAPEMLPRLFGKFARGARRGSTGLGLFIVRGIIEAHGGRIEVGRSASNGAEFRFFLPAGTPSFL